MASRFGACIPSPNPTDLPESPYRPARTTYTLSSRETRSLSTPYAENHPDESSPQRIFSQS